MRVKEKPAAIGVATGKYKRGLETVYTIIALLLNCGAKFLREQIDAGLLRYVPRGHYRYVSAEALKDYLVSQEQKYSVGG